MYFYESKIFDKDIARKQTPVILTDDCLYQIIKYLDNIGTLQTKNYREILIKFDPYCDLTLF